MVDQEKIHNQCFSDDPKERIHALEELNNLFSSMPDKQKAWNDLLRLTNNKDSDVRYSTVEALGSVFSQVPDKQKAWDELVKLTSDEEWKVRSKVVNTLQALFFNAPDKQKAWDKLVKLTSDEESGVRYQASSALDSAFPQVPDKQKAWKDLHELTFHEDDYVRSNAANALCSAFSELPNKQAWDDLHRLTNDEASSVRYYVAYALGSVFSQIPDKQQAWKDLHRLTNDEDSSVRSNVASSLGLVFSQVLDKQQAWDDLHKLTDDEDSGVRSNVASTLGLVFSLVLDKQQAWDDLHRLTNDVDRCVRSNASFSLGSAFSQVPYKEQALDDLNRLTKDEYCSVRTFANHSLGKVSIFKASKAENEENYKKELENAIEFFEKAIIGSPDKWYSLPKFCLLFYRSFHSIIFKRQESKEEINECLAAVKSTIEGSKSKKLLFEAVQNLAKALDEIQSLKNLDLEAKKSELNSYRQYCDLAAELMKYTDDKAPFATEVLRKGLPILDRNLKAIIEEIQKKSKIACKESKGTEAEEIVCDINKEIQNVIFDYQVQYLEATKILEDILSIIKMKIPQIPENKLILSKIEAVDDRIISADKYHDLPLIISLMSTVKVVPKQEIDQIHRKIEYISGKSDLIYAKTIRIEAKLDDISFAIFRIKLNSYNVIPNLDAMKKELEKLNEIARLNEPFLDKLNSTQATELNGVNNNIQDRLDDLASLIDDLPKNNEIKEILDKLNKLKQSGPDILLQRSSGITSLISFFVMFAQLYQQYIR